MGEWVNLDDNTLSEKSQKEKDKYCMVSLICKIQKVKLTEAESRMIIIRNW